MWKSDWYSIYEEVYQNVIIYKKNLISNKGGRVEDSSRRFYRCNKNILLNTYIMLYLIVYKVIIFLFFIIIIVYIITLGSLGFTKKYLQYTSIQ